MKKLIVCLLTMLLLAGMIILIASVGTAEARMESLSTSLYYGGTAIDDNGTLWAWGNCVNPSMPHVVAGITNASKASGGRSPTAVVKSDGTVWMLDYMPCGSVPEEYYELSSPTPLANVSGVVDVTFSGELCLLLKSDGTMWQYRFDQGQSVYMGIDNVKQISAADHNWALVKNDGTVMTTGLNNYGQLGRGTVSTSQGEHNQISADDLTLTVDKLNDVRMIAVGSEYAMALKADGTVWTWGRNVEGQLGDGQTDDTEPYRSYPQQVPGLSNITSIAAGSWSAYALRDDGTVWAWGDNRYYGMLGDGTFVSRNRPVRVCNLSGIVEISASELTALAIDTSGNVWAWGHDEYGELGDGGLIDYSPVPVKIDFGHPLAGTVVKPDWMVPERPAVVSDDKGQAAASGNGGDLKYLTTSGDGTIYAFYPHKLEAYAPDGDLKWSLPIVGRWMYGDEYEVVTDMDGTGYGTMWETPKPVFDTDDGYLYLYTLEGLSDDDSVTVDRWDGTDPTKAHSESIEKALMAIAPDGMVSWTYRVTDNVGVEDKASVRVAGDRVYFFHCYNETVLDKSGKVLFNLADVSDPAAIGDDGTIYVLPATWQNNPILLQNPPLFVDLTSGAIADYRNPGHILEAYGKNGRLLWSKDLGDNAQRSYMVPDARRLCGSLPLYCNESIYVPTFECITALDLSGNVKWTSKFPESGKILLFDLMPMDARGNLYYEIFDRAVLTRLLIIGPDGGQTTVVEADSGNIRTAFDGVLYTVVPVRASDPGSCLGTVTVRAFEAKRGTYLWNYTLPVNETHTVLLTSENAGLFFHDTMVFHPATQDNGYTWANVIPSGDLVYVDFRAAIYDSPVVPGRTNITYASALYAINKTSGLVLEQPLNSFTQAVAANNSTVYYVAQDGKLNIAGVLAGTAAGVVVIASAILFGKFFLLGAIARAKSRLGHNENRDRVLRFVIDYPGATLSEISRQGDINMGTARYHILILGLNHKVRVFKEGKFIRYFPNSNLYSPEEQLIIALLRRDPVRGIVQALMNSAMLTNSDLSCRVGQSESSVNETLKLLCNKGITRKEKSPDGRILYSVHPAMAKVLDKLDKRLEFHSLKL